MSFACDLARSECHINAGPFNLDAKLVFFVASSQLLIVEIASPSVSHDDMYWSGPFPLNFGIAWTFYLRLSAVIRFSTASAAISGAC